MLFQAFRRTLLVPVALVSLAAQGCREDAESPTAPESTSAPTAATAAALPIFTFLAVGGQHTCALDASGAAWCWGDNSDGQVGDGQALSRTTPGRVAGGLRFVQISAGSRTTCAITTQNLAYCWGAG